MMLSLSSLSSKTTLGIAFSILLSCFSCNDSVNAFQPISTTLQRSTHRTSPLWLAKANRRGGGRGGPVGQKKKKTKKVKDGKNKKRSLHEIEIDNASRKSAVQLPSNKSRAPPWKVLSPQDARKNVQIEKKRRKLAREGIQMEEDDEQEEESRRLSRVLLSDVERSLIGWRRFHPSRVPCGMTFVGSYLDKRLPARLGVPEIAFLGRSNVGKSSLLNKLSTPAIGNDYDEARVGKTPGATASVNLYVLLGKTKQSSQSTKPILGLVDLPGFGYAKLSREVQDSVQQAAERYLSKREELALGILLVDARRVPSQDDRIVLAALYDLDVPLVVVATKIDKLTKNERDGQLEIIRQGLGLPEGQPLAISSVSGEGTKQLWRIILEACETKVDELKTTLNKPGGKQAMEEERSPNIQFDAEGNMVLPFDDGQPLAYDQGYDWIQADGVMHEDYYGNEDDMGEYVEEELNDAGDFESLETLGKELTFRDLKKKARRMERQGEV